MKPSMDELVANMRGRFGPAAVLTGAEAIERAQGWSRLGKPLAVLRPASTAETSAMISSFTQAGIPVVPWGGKTGLVSGGFVDNAVAISLERMNRIEMIDPVDGIMLVEAGCVVQTACEAAEAKEMFFPLDLGSRGSATIGGVISTNAGGLRVLRFGMMRELVLGLEAVLADGTIVSSLHPLMKNNTGYDLKQLFIGSEGTLGVVTRAMLRLRPRLPARNTAFVALDSFDAVASLLRTLERRLGGQLSSFEVLWPEYYDIVTKPPGTTRPVLPHGHAYYVLVEAMGGDFERDQEKFEAVLESVLESGLVADAVIARSEADAQAMWDCREKGEGISQIGPYVACDVSLRVSKIPEFVTMLRETLEKRWPGTRTVLLGHAGDGNIHVVASVGENTQEARDRVSAVVLKLTADLGGSISAEHGIGLDKREYLPLSRSPGEIAVMRSIKRALDPRNLMNPGKVLPTAEGSAVA